jgi:DNA polymerase-1
MKGLSHDEKQVGIVFGFIKQILSLANKFYCSKFIFCWDHRNSYRKIEYSSYKDSRRKEQTEEQQKDMLDAFRQFDEIREILLPMMGFKNNFQQSGYEADDLIALIVKRFPEETIIVSTDNDLLQLIHADRFHSVKIYNFKEIVGDAEFRNKWFGLDPIKWANVKAIAGCGSDEVKGIVGVGNTTAAKYLAGISKGKSVEKIESEENKQIAARNYPLVALPYANGLKPINIKWINPDDISIDKFKAIFGQYGFKSLLKEDEILRWTRSFFGENDGRK